MFKFPAKILENVTGNMEICVPITGSLAPFYLGTKEQVLYG